MDENKVRKSSFLKQKIIYKKKKTVCNKCDILYIENFRNDV